MQYKSLHKKTFTIIMTQLGWADGVVFSHMHIMKKTSSKNPRSCHAQLRGCPLIWFNLDSINVFVYCVHSVCAKLWRGHHRHWNLKIACKKVKNSFCVIKSICSYHSAIEEAHHPPCCVAGSHFIAIDDDDNKGERTPYYERGASLFAEIQKPVMMTWINSRTYTYSM